MLNCEAFAGSDELLRRVHELEPPPPFWPGSYPIFPYEICVFVGPAHGKSCAGRCNCPAPEHNLVIRNLLIPIGCATMVFIVSRSLKGSPDSDAVIARAVRPSPDHANQHLGLPEEGARIASSPVDGRRTLEAGQGCFDIQICKPGKNRPRNFERAKIILRSRQAVILGSKTGSLKKYREFES